MLSFVARGGLAAWNSVQEIDIFLAGLRQRWRLIINHFAQLFETVFRVGSRQPQWPGLRVDCCPFPPLMVSQCPGGISVWNGGKVLSGARRQRLAMFAIHSLGDLCTVRQEQGRYDSGCYFARVPKQESSTVLVPTDIDGECPGGISRLTANFLTSISDRY